MEPPADPLAGPRLDSERSRIWLGLGWPEVGGGCGTGAGGWGIGVRLGQERVLTVLVLGLAVDLGLLKSGVNVSLTDNDWHQS